MEEHPAKPPEELQKPFEDFSCGWYKDRLLLPGRLFIAKTHVTFQPQFGQSPVTINMADITGISKKNTAYVFPNAIEIATKTQKFFFGSFYFRDQAFTTLQNLIPNTHEGEEHGDENDESFSQSTDVDPEEAERSRTRAFSGNSDDEEMKIMSAGQKAFAAVKRTMTKSASERSIIERSGTPPPGSGLSPGNVSPAPSVSPAPASRSSRDDAPARSSRDDVPAMELSREHEVAAEVPAYAQTDSSVEEHAEESHGDAIDGGAQDAHEPSGSPHPAPEQPPPISPLHSPLIEDYEQDGSANTQAHAHEHEHEVAQEAAEHPTTPTQDSPTQAPEIPLPALNIGSSTSAPPSPLPNSTPIKKQPELVAIKLPPIVENCEHMTYPPYSDTFAPFIEETFPCPIQDFYRIVLATNFWSDVNDSCGYTDATVTPWLTRNNSTGPCCLYRQINFKMDLNAKIGPKSTRVQQSQRCRLKNSKELILETSSVSADVPYADSFTTDNLLIIKSANGGASCHLRVACRVNFTKTTWGFGGLIEKNAIQGSKDFFATWIIAVRQKIEKEYTKPRSLATPPPAQRAMHNSPQTKSPAIRPPLTSTHHSSPSLTTASHHTSHHHHTHHKQPPAIAPPIATPSPSAFTPISPSPKKFWPTLQQQAQQMSIPVAALCFVVLLIIAIGLPYTLYLHARLAHTESHIKEFNHAVSRIENKISFMHLYINYLKEHPDQPLPASLATAQDNLKTELAGLSHLLEITNTLENKMDTWKKQLDGAGRSLASTQELVDALRTEMGGVLLRREREGEGEEGGGRGWVYFSVGLVVSLGVVGASMYFFRENLPFKIN